MEIVIKKIETVFPYEKNPRKNDAAVEAVANSIREFGFKVPIVLDKNNVIVCGHTRYKAAKRLGMAELPCVMADDLTEDQIKAFRLADNKSAELAEWDIGLLAGEVNDISEIDMTAFGFDLDSLAGNWIDERELQDQLEDDLEDEFDDIEKLEKHYGVPYQGNKSRIADIIISILPAGKRMVDLFGGGGGR